MRVDALRPFLAQQVSASREEGVLFSIHLKATMMKVSDPIIFGHAVRAYVRRRSSSALRRLARRRRRSTPTTAFGALLIAIDALPARRAGRDPRRDRRRLRRGPGVIAMVDSDRGVTNLHVPSDVIVDASMPAAIRASGKMWNAAGELQDTNFVIPDHLLRRAVRGRPSTTAASTERSSRRRWDRLPTSACWRRPPRSTARTTRPSRSPSRARSRVRCDAGETLIEHEVEAGDIWRMCRTTDAAIQDWSPPRCRTRPREPHPGDLLARRDPRPRPAQLLEKVRPGA